jgi:hypothetical protein
MADMTIRIQGDNAGRLTITDSGVVTRDNGAVTERDVTVAVRALAQDGQEGLAGRVQGWWWTSGGM